MASISVSKFLIGLVCMIGLIVQVTDVTNRYLEYRTKTLIEMELPVRIQMPKLSVCFRSDGLLKKDAIRRTKNIIIPEGSKNWTAFYLEVEKLSVQDMFDYTPSPSEVLASKNTACQVRMPKSFSIKYPYSKASECYQMLKIRKFIQRQFMCYKFSVKLKEMRQIKDAKKLDAENSTQPLKREGEAVAQKNDMQIEESSLTPNLPGVIYSVSLDNAYFGGVALLTAFVHGADTSPLFDSIFTPSVQHDRDKKSNSSYADMQITYRSLSIQRLEPPYSTMCSSYHPHRSRLEATLSKVRRDAVKLLRIIPTLDQIYERRLPRDAEQSKAQRDNTTIDENKDYDETLPITTSYHVRNASLAMHLQSLIRKHTLINPECSIKYYVTTIKSSVGKSVKMTLNWPQDVTLTIRYSPVDDILDYIIYLSTCLGLWLGVAINDVMEWGRLFLLAFCSWLKRGELSNPFERKLIRTRITADSDETLKSVEQTLSKFEARMTLRLEKERVRTVKKVSEIVKKLLHNR